MPDEIGLKFNEAVALRLKNHLDDCQASVERLWQRGYQTPWLALLRGNLQLDLGNYIEADSWYSLAWSMTAPNNAVRPEAARWFPEIALPFAYSRMRLGRWDAFTWSLWEIGRLTRSWRPAPNTVPWSGQPDKLLVLSEGGYGDAFLFTRFFQKLDPIQRAASRFVMGPAFARLKGFRENWDGMETIWPDQIFEWGTFKYSTALMSLLSVTDIHSLADIPKAEPLLVDPLKSSVRFGIAWRAEELGVQKRIRSIDHEEELSALADFEFVNLCPGRSFEQRVGMPHLVEADLDCWTKTARVIAGLDAVVTVDSAVAHVSGALGVPTLLLLPRAVDWKYLTEGEDCFWWKSARLIRNDSPYSWNTALTRVAEILEDL